MYAVLIQVDFDAERESAFLHATRMYRRRSRAEAGNVRVDLLRPTDRANAFFIYELYRNQHAYGLHTAAEYTRAWLNACETSAINVTVLPLVPEAVDAVPPPLPTAARPVIESAARWPSAAAEAHERQRVLRNARSGAPSEVILAGTEGGPRLPRLRVVLESLEFAAADAGFLQGAPDVSLVLGAFVWSEGELEVLGRAVYRRTLHEDTPCKIDLSQPLFDVPLFVGQMPAQVGLLLISLEEGGGRDIESAYRSLAHPGEFRLWSKQDGIPEPLSLPEWFSPTHTGSWPVEVLYQAQSLAEAASSDTWVGAATALFGFASVGFSRVARFHTVSEDQRNDWLVQVSAHLY